jgi:hypothetical protein
VPVLEGQFSREHFLVTSRTLAAVADLYGFRGALFESDGSSPTRHRCAVRVGKWRGESTRMPGAAIATELD